MGIKYKVNENFFKKWSHKMAYVLGYLYADGSLEDARYLRGKYVRVSSIDGDSVQKIRNWLDSEHKIVEIENKKGNRKKQYFLRIGSHILYDDLTKRGLFPNKSLTVEFPHIPKKYFCSFVAGYFDGDGCVLIRKGRGKNSKQIIKGLRVVFTCGSKKFLKSLGQELGEFFGTKQRKVYDSNRSFMLAFSTEDSIKIFKNIYSIKDLKFLERKYLKFCEYFELRPNRVDKEIKNIIEYNSTGRVAK